MIMKLRNTLGPFFLVALCPPVVMLLWYTNVHLQGSLSALWQLVMQQGIVQVVHTAWGPYIFGTALAWKIIACFSVMQLLLMRCLPGKTVYGPVTPKGNVPVYKRNGVLAYSTTMLLYCAMSFGLHWFSPSILYDNLGAILGALNLFSVLFCGFLYIKGRFFPSTTDASVSGNLLFDYYWGTELYPEVLGWNIKKFITCRFGMMSWGLFLISYAAKQANLGDLANSMLISVVLQLLYITKFFIWEHGYLRSLDIMHDRAGFYICWGCLVWVPCVYTSPSMYLVMHPIHLSLGLATVIFLLGSASILVNYLADRQRLLVRATDGRCKIWGQAPRMVFADYKTEDGQTKQSVLLASGWWGVARHFHYIPELLGAFFWSVPALFTHCLPYFYVSFLTLLLVDRAFRDDRRCAKKYGNYWHRYCELVPYKIVPLVV